MTPAESVKSAPPSNLPAPLTSLIGRDKEVEAVRCSLLHDEVRLLTLVGPPGIGKTRLSIAVAVRLSVNFRDGVYFVALDTVNDTQLVIATIGRSLGLKPSEKQPLGEAVAGYLRDKQILLVLDNFEQVLDAGPQILQLLSACPSLKALVTSREPLHAYGECRFQVPPLELPDRQHLPDPDTLAGLASVVLFTQRAQALKPDLVITPANAGTIAAICLHLDGLPLAIELAAAQIEDLTPEQILAGLGDRLKILKGDLRYLPLRQQTLRGAIDWSYHLLTIGERTLFRRLGVFVGGCSLAEVHAICNAHQDLPFEPQAGMAALSSKSLLYRETGVDGEPRWRMLESIREYALKRLAEAGEAETLLARHAAFFAGYLEERFGLILSREQDRVILEIDADIDNVRAAWDWALAARRQDLIRRSSQALLWYYEMQSSFSEAEAACARAMAVITDDPHVDLVLLAVLRSYHGYSVGRLGRLDDARAELERGCAELRQANARAESALPLIMLGTVAWQEGDYVGARPLLEESLQISRTMGNTFCTALALFFLGLVAHASGDYGQANESFREALRLSRIQGQPRLISMTSVWSSLTLLALGQYTEARERLQEGLALARTSRIRWLVGVAQGHLGLVLNAQGDHAGARMALLEAVASAQESGNQWDRAWGEVGLGDAELGLGNSGAGEHSLLLGIADCDGGARPAHRTGGTGRACTTASPSR